jgi:hypothetical protein
MATASLHSDHTQHLPYQPEPKMNRLPFNWADKGFSAEPKMRIAPDDGLTMYRAWGGSSTEWGSGYFSLEKPLSVLDAELRFNIVDWGNGVRFLSTFRLKSRFPYYAGPVAHGTCDISKPGTQIFLPSPFAHMVEKMGTFEMLKQDVHVLQRTGSA